jgi:hypothetical protein
LERDLFRQQKLQTSSLTQPQDLLPVGQLSSTAHDDTMWSLIYKIGIRQLAYIALAGTRATIIWIVFNLCTITLFYSNVIIYLAEDAITGFILSNLAAIL